MYCPCVRPAMSTKAGIDWADNCRTRLPGPLTVTETWRGDTRARIPRPVPRTVTGTSLTSRSTGAGRISTVTTASRGRRSRAIDSGNPIVTLSRTRALAPFTLTGSVVACESCCTILAGPITSTLAGEATTGPMTNPGAGVPSTLGTTGTRLLTDVSNWSDTVDGSTCRTVTPCGTVTSAGVR